jgi:hypothetical protein
MAKLPAGTVLSVLWLSPEQAPGSRRPSRSARRHGMGAFAACAGQSVRLVVQGEVPMFARRCSRPIRSLDLGARRRCGPSQLLRCGAPLGACGLAGLHRIRCVSPASLDATGLDSLSRRPKYPPFRAPKFGYPEHQKVHTESMCSLLTVHYRHREALGAMRVRSPGAHSGRSGSDVQLQVG